MAILPQAGYLGSAGGNLLGTGGSNTSTAAQGVFNVGQFQPYSVNNPLGQTSFSGGQANTTMSPLQQQLGTLFGNQIGSNLGGSSASYNPNTSFLPQQYQSIFGNMQGNANSMFNSLQSAQQPWVQQNLQSNLDNEFSKGTLASTAGSFQTAGAQTAANAQMNTNQATAQQYALQNAQAQFGAANSTAQLGENQAQFAPQFAQSQTQGLYSNLLNAGSLMNQQTSLGGSLGALQSNANTQAAYPSFLAAQQQDQAQSGLLNGLLTGNGTGGLLGSLFGTTGAGGTQSGGLLSGVGSSAGNFLNGLFGGGQSTVNGSNVTGGTNDGLFGGTTGTATNPFTGASTGGSTSGGFDTAGAGNIESGVYNSPDNTGSNDLTSTSGSSGTDQQLNDSNDQLLQELGFNSAGGQATTGIQGLSQAMNLSDTESAHLSSQVTPPSLSNINPLQAGISALNFGTSAASGSDLGMAGAATGLAASLGAPKSVTGPLSTGVGLAGLGMNLASGNVLGAVGGALGLGGKAGLPNYLTQPLALALSALTGNPIGIGINAAKVGSGLLNILQGRNYNGSWTPNPADLKALSDQTTSQLEDATNAKSSDVLTQLASNPENFGANIDTTIAPTFTPSQLAQIGQQQAQNEYQTAMGFINEGTDWSSYTPGSAMPLGPSTPGSAFIQNTLQNAASGAGTSNPQAMAAIQQLLQQNNQVYSVPIQNS